MKNYEIVTIGGGPAGITLAKMLGKSRKMAVIRPENHSMIYCAMPYVIEGLISTEKTLKKDALVTEAGAELIRDHVIEIDFSQKKIVLSDSTEIGYEKLIIATGAEPFILPVKGAFLRGVTGFKTENNLKEILSHIESGLKKAVVVGAGAIGIELAQALNDAGLSVDLVDMGSSILPNLVDREMTDDLENEIIRKGINLHLQTKVTELEGSEWVEHVVLDNGSIISFNEKDSCADDGEPTHDGMVVFAAGMKPVVDLVRDSGIELGKDGIVINSRMETSIPDVYAVGDCAQYVSGITCGVISGKLATNAVPMAKVLGFNLMGQEREYPGFYNGAATKVGPFFVGGTGLSQSAADAAGYDTVTGYSEVTTQFPIMPDAEKIKFKIVADRKTKRVIGAQIVGGEPVTGRIDLLTYAIQKNSTINDLAELSYSSQPYQSFYPAANGIVLAAEEILGKL